MTRDKQLLNIDLDRVLEKRRLDQALNVKEFAVLAGISYSAARSWFRLPGFPAVRNVVFWSDFVAWRQCRTIPLNADPSRKLKARTSCPSESSSLASSLPSRAAKILADAG